MWPDDNDEEQFAYKTQLGPNEILAVTRALLREEIFSNAAEINKVEVEYQGQIDELNKTIANLRGDLANKENARRLLNDRVYELEHTPEIKADIEGAYKRGFADAERRFNRQEAIVNQYGLGVAQAGSYAGPFHEIPPQL